MRTDLGRNIFDCKSSKWLKHFAQKVYIRDHFFFQPLILNPNLDDFFEFFEGMPLRGAPLRGALGRAPPPVCRAEILKKFTGKSVPENYTLLSGKHKFFVILRIRTLWDLSKTTDLVETIRMQFFVQN